MIKYFQNKIILVTGGTGSIGSELVKQLIKYKPKQLRILSRDESKQYYLMEQINHPGNVRFFIGDVRDQERLDMAFQDVDIVFHAAAMKHVPLCEYNPFEAVKTNIMGSQNVINAALRHNVDKVIAISTDKAANPSNVMGTSKLMMEKLIINANFYRGWSRTKFSCVRFGNVAWARGSVLPLWKKQVERDNTIKITNPKMTRFFMSIPQSIDLVLKTAKLTYGGEIFILKMSSIKISDLATIFVKKYCKGKKIKIINTGNRLGEKMHEDLYVPNLKPKAIFEDKEILIIIPELEIYDLKQPERAYEGFTQKKMYKDYCSDKSININKIKSIV
ncbi:MAG: SDR family NAD(P)-dependent oxidoreductase [Patescibacteria group bacterium]|jgi:FlaA1/EpsC-like NDP-sugar epimerase